MEKIQTPTPRPRLNSTKVKIVKFQRENPKISFEEIAEKLGTTPNYVSQCLVKRRRNKKQKILTAKRKFPQFDHFEISKIVGASPGYVQLILKKFQTPKPKVSVPTPQTQTSSKKVWETQTSDKVNFVLEFLIQNPKFEMIVTQEIPTGKRILILK